MYVMNKKNPYQDKKKQNKKVSKSIPRDRYKVFTQTPKGFEVYDGYEDKKQAFSNFDGYPYDDFTVKNGQTTKKVEYWNNGRTKREFIIKKEPEKSRLRYNIYVKETTDGKVAKY